MAESSSLLVITCNSETSAASVNAELAAADSSGRLIKKENLDGNAATWVVVASAAMTSLPKILDSLAKVIEALKVRSIKVGEREIQNPTAADLRAFRKGLKS